MNLPIGQKRSIEVGGQTISGISFQCNLVAAAVNTLPTITQFSASAVTVSAILKRGGRSYNICNDVLATLAMESSFFNASFQYANPAIFGNGITVVTQTAGLAGEIMVPMVIDFGGVLNLKNDDKLIVEVSSQSSAVGVSMSVVNSYIAFDVIEAIGVEEFVPIINVNSIAPGESNNTYSLGNNVQKITFINTGIPVTTTTTALSPILDVQIASDKYSLNDDFKTHLAKRINMFGDGLIPAVVARGYSFNYYNNDIPLQNTVLKVIFQSANVVAGNNFIVSRSLISSPELAQRAAEMHAKHEAINRNDIFGF